MKCFNNSHIVANAATYSHVTSPRLWKLTNGCQINIDDLCMHVITVMTMLK